MACLSTDGGTLCPVCGHHVVCAVKLAQYELFGCAACGCWSSDALTRGAARSFEPEHYFRNADADRNKWNELLRRLGAPLRDVASVLDVGCGTGAFLEFINGQLSGIHREGIEIDPGRAQAARSRNPKATIHTADALDALVSLRRAFDLITLWDVFEHVPDPASLLRELAKVVSPRGVIYIQTIHEESLLPLLGRLIYTISGRRITYPVLRTHEAHHLVFFTAQGLRMLANSAGLNIRDLWFDRLAHRRMDGSPIVTALAAFLLALENAVGNGLFVNLILERR